MSNDDNEIIELSCDNCKGSKKGTYKELFGDLLSITLLPKLVCKCGGQICIGLTGEFREQALKDN